MSLPVEHLLDAVERLCAQERRFPREAYLFVVASLGHAVAGLPAARRADPARRHLHGREVIEGVLGLAREEFGPLAAAVLSEWGMTRGRHVGEIVYGLVGAGQLSTQPDDRIEDFETVTDLLPGLTDGAPSRGGARGRG